MTPTPSPNAPPAPPRGPSLAPYTNPIVASPRTAIGLHGRVLTISAILKPTGARCPAKVVASTTVGGRRARKNLKVTTLTVTGKTLCLAEGKLAAAARPALRKRFKVTFSGAGMRTHAVGVIRRAG